MAKLALKRPAKATSGSGGGGFERPDPLPEGKYRVILTNAQDASEVFGDAGKQYGGVAVEAEVSQGDFKGQSRTLWVFPASEASRSLAEVLGGDPDDEEFEFEYKDLDGLEVNVYLDIRKSKKGNSVNSIKRFAPAPRK